MTWKTIAFLILSFLLIVFTVQNHILIDLKFLVWEIVDFPLVFVLLFGLVFGFFLSLMMQLPRIIKLKRELKRVVRELEASEKIIAVHDEDVNNEGVTMGSDYKGGFFSE